MIYTVTLNPSLDYTVSLNALEQGKIAYYDEASYRPGGKGVNVSVMLTSLGAENTALGIGAGAFGREAVRLLEESGCKTDFVFLPDGNSRLNFQICTAGGEETKLNGKGPEISAAAMEQLENKLARLQDGDSLVLAGTIPPSLPQDTYFRLLKRVEGRTVRTVVDAAGEALLSALPQHPFLIKPNREELGEVFGVEITDLSMARDCARALQDKGARNVAVSLGEKGALLVCEDGSALFCRAARGTVRSTVGAGDSLVAGFLYGHDLHGTLEGALRWGTAASSATVFCPGIADGAQVKALYPQVGNVHPL